MQYSPVSQGKCQVYPRDHGSDYTASTAVMDPERQGYCMEFLRTHYLHTEMEMCPSYWLWGPLGSERRGRTASLGRCLGSGTAVTDRHLALWKDHAIHCLSCF